MSALDLTSIAVIGVSLFFSAFFSMTETAITSLGVIRTRHLLEQRAGFRSHLDLWMNQPARVLTTILFFRNAFNALAAAVATMMAARYSESYAIAIATGITTLLVLLISDIVPKSFARGRPEHLADGCLRIVYYLYRAFYPLMLCFAAFTNFVFKKIGGGQSVRPPITEDEIEYMIEEGEKAGVLDDSKKDMLSGVFEFDETKVREIMTPRTDIVAVEKKQEVDDALALIIQSGHSRVPVYEERIDNVIGIVFAKDVLRHYAKSSGERQPITLADIMREPLFVPESKPLMEVFKDLKRSKIHMAIVIDEYGGTAGLVTMEDILEEIVGDIQDEFDAEEAEIMEVDANTYDVAGSVNINDFMEHFGLEDSFSEEVEGEVDTIGGWMTQLLGDLPEVGQTLIHEPLTIEVKEVDRHRIQKLRVVRMQPPVMADA